MRALILGLLGSVALATAAAADGAYVGLFGGVNYEPDESVTGQVYAGGMLVSETELTHIFDPGLVDGGFAGYGFDLGGGFSLSVEAEGAQRLGDHVKTRVGDLNSFEESAEVQVTSAMANLRLGYAVAPGWELTAGGGIGWGHWVYDYTSDFGDDQSGDSLAWQAIGGVSYEVVGGFHVGVEYRYFALTDDDLHIDATGPGGILIQRRITGYSSHSVLLTGRIDLAPLLHSLRLD